MLGQDINKAKQILEKDGFHVKFETMTPPTTAEEIKTMKLNIVMNQSIDAFTVVYKKGETITLYYYDHKPEIPADTPTTPVTPGTDTGSGDTNQTTPTNPTGGTTN